MLQFQDTYTEPRTWGKERLQGRKLQTNISVEHRYKNLQQNSSK